MVKEPQSPEAEQLLRELHHLAQAVNQSRAVQHGERIAYATLCPSLERALARAQNQFEPYGLKLLTDRELEAILNNQKPRGEIKQ